jgi:tetratricopeptide (TPR) repeat protein
MNPNCPTCGRQLDPWGKCNTCGVSIAKKTAQKEALVLMGLLMGALVVVGVVVSKVAGNPFRIFNNLGLWQSDSYEVTQASKNLPAPQQPQETISPQQIAELRVLFEDRQFESLNLIYENAHQDVEDDFSNEYKLQDAFRIFHSTLPSYEELLADWIDNSPDHFAPYLARAHYYFAKGWESWGSGTAKDRTQEQFKMRWQNFKRAIDDIDTALGIHQKLLTAYMMMINISAAMARETELQNWAKEAVALFPHSFLIRSEYIRVISPDWGGSYRKMENFAKSAEFYADINPYFTCLYGYIYCAQAKDLLSRKKYGEAAALYTKAMAFGDYWYFYSRRAQLYYAYLKELDKGLEDVEYSIYLRPTIEQNYHLRSRIYFEKADFEAAAKDLQTAYHLNPNNAEILRWQEWTATHLLNLGHNIFKTDLNQAIEKYTFSLIFNPENSEAYYWRAVAYWHLNRLDLAADDLEKSCDLGHKEACDRYYQVNNQWVN